MTKRKPSQRIMTKLKDRLYTEEFKERWRQRAQDFTRDRKMPFVEVVLFMMGQCQRSLQVELAAFMRKVGGSAQWITNSAFNQSRKKIRAGLFADLSATLIEEFYTDNDERVQLWKGHRLLATDSSTIELPSRRELADIYGQVTNQYEVLVVHGRFSVLYDVLNNLAIEGVLAPYRAAERDLAKQHLHACSPNDLVIYDRGYPSFEMMHTVRQHKVHFLMRCPRDHNKEVEAFMRSGRDNATVELCAGAHRPDLKDRRVTVRMVRVALNNGEFQVLLTSLLDTVRYPTSDFKDLYHRRWGVETFFDEVKNIVRMEHFTGHSPHVIEQDFQCALFLCNVHSLLVSEAQEELPAKHINRKLSYKINCNVSFGFFKEQVPLLLTKDQPMELTMRDLHELFLSATVPIRPGRSAPRTIDKFKNRPKPKYLFNSKPAF